MKIDWDNYEVIESDDYTRGELEDTIEGVREYLQDIYPQVNVLAEDLLEELLDTDRDNNYED